MCSREFYWIILVLLFGYRIETKMPYLPKVFRLSFLNTFHHKNLYNFDPLKPHFYIVKQGFTGVYIIFLISAQKHRFAYSLELPLSQ